MAKVMMHSKDKNPSFLRISKKHERFTSAMKQNFFNFEKGAFCFPNKSLTLSFEITKGFQI
jgi:hypothetical protein